MSNDFSNNIPTKKNIPKSGPREPNITIVRIPAKAKTILLISFVL